MGLAALTAPGCGGAHGLCDHRDKYTLRHFAVQTQDSAGCSAAREHGGRQQCTCSTANGSTSEQASSGSGL